MLMLVLVSLLVATLLCAVGPAVLFVINLRRYAAPQGAGSPSLISVLIPARDEERNIAACVDSVLASEGVFIEVLVLDDASTDRTAEFVNEFAARDARVRLVKTQTLPAGWNGKQRACWLLAQEAQGGLFLFLDADVRVAPDALRRCAGQMESSELALLSGFPKQITVGWLETMLIPLIHFVLLSFLPMGRMRASTSPAFSAGCGQFFLAERDAYFASGGHAGIRETRHDGLRLPQLFREAGYCTDIFDLTSLARVRMYDSPSAVWMGLAKNATEGIATPGRIVPFSVLLVLGQVLPAALFALMITFLTSFTIVGATFDQPLLGWSICGVIMLAFVASYLPRLLAVRRFEQPLMSALLHPLGIVLLLCVQWYALGKQVFGKPVAWRARSYASDTGEEV